MRSLFAAIAAIMFTVPVYAETKIALTGENTKISFVGTKPGGKHEGGFKKLAGAAVIDSEVLKKLEVIIETDSIYSDNEKLTAHLKAPDFFGVKDNPKAKFASTKIEKTEKGVSITGDMTINGKTKHITIPATVVAKDGSLKITSTFFIDKRDYGMTYGGGKIDDQVTIQVAVDAK